jgi:methylated-DNA-[protein]-cysteine S-methyltransferase
VRYVSYRADGWGVGELVFDGDVLVHSELPRARDVRGLRGLRGLSSYGDSPLGLAARLRDYFAGARDDFRDVELDLDCATEFQRAVTAALRAVPYGETVTYGELAALAGHPGAQRAVGTFCARNRFGVVVPCHRVVAADGLGSYGSLGVSYKRRLLELEDAAL